ncbi:MAG: hypothetical protein QW530_01350 [Candidatus Micrarchaeaceae archaeon]
MAAMLGLFALAGIACFAFLVPESGAECPGALLIVPLFASATITAYDFAFSLVPAHYYSLALHALLLISTTTFVSVTTIYLLGRACAKPSARGFMHTLSSAWLPSLCCSMQ